MAADSVFGTLALVFQSVTLLALPLELWLLHREGCLDGTRLREMAGSASTLLPFLALGLLAAGPLEALEAEQARLGLPLSSSWPAALLCLVLVDLAYYCDHRLGHEVRLFWAAGHSVHHSSRFYDPSTALRVSVLDGPLTSWVYLPALLFFPVGLVVSCLGVVVAFQTWLHTGRVGRLPLLDPWLNTPSNHRVHHGSQGAYLDKNYGGILIIWDRLFGTWAAEGEQPVYGLTTPLTSSHPVAVHGFELSRLAVDVRRAPWSRRLGLLLGRP